MTLRAMLQREKYVVLHGQSWRFRVVKYIILIAAGIAMYEWQGGTAVAVMFLILFLMGITVHFLFRWKTKAWTQSWGPYKKLDLIE